LLLSVSSALTGLLGVGLDIVGNLGMAVAAFGSSMSASLPPALISAATIGFGAGGMHLLVRLAWADY